MGMTPGPLTATIDTDSALKPPIEVSKVNCRLVFLVKLLFGTVIAGSLDVSPYMSVGSEHAAELSPRLAV